MDARRQRGNVFRMASFRLAVLGTLLSTLSAIIVFALIYIATGRAAREEFAPIVTGDFADLQSDIALDGTLRAQIAMAIRASSHSFYALADAQGRWIMGNIALPPGGPGWHMLTAGTATRTEGSALPPGVAAVVGQTRRLTDGRLLFIGEDASVFARLNRFIAYLFAAVFGVMLTIGLLASLIIANYSLRRVRAISSVSHQIVAGDLSHRIKLYGIDDELDVLITDLNRMLATIERLVENARQVTSDIAHDLRTPLTRLRDHLVLAARRTAEPGPAGPAPAGGLVRAIEQTDQIIAIFAALLRIAELDAGASKASFAPLDLSALCGSLAESYQPVAEDRGQRLAAEIEPGCHIRGDADAITQMVVNLVENAIRHCPPGTEMALRVRHAGEWVAIEMADRGPGIPEALHERAFDRFVRLDPARRGEGHGLGLALVRAVVLAHEGSVALADNGPGLLVRIFLPAS